MKTSDSIFFPAPRRLLRKRKDGVRTPPAPAGLNVVGAELTGVGGGEAEVHVTFDTTIADPLDDVGGADPAKWTVRAEGTMYQAGLVEMTAYNTIRIYCYETGPDEGANTVFYSNAPSDIRDESGRQLAAFSREL